MKTPTTTLRCPPVIGTTARRSHRWSWLAVAGLLGMAFAYYFFNPTEHAIFPSCRFYQLTDLLCPGCGGQRALHCLLHGEIGRAFHQNALFILSLPLGGWLALRLFQFWRTDRALPALYHHRLTPWVVFLLVISFGIVRNLPGFAWLRP
jgi:hypothetical protein